MSGTTACTRSRSSTRSAPTAPCAAARASRPRSARTGRSRSSSRGSRTGRSCECPVLCHQLHFVTEVADPAARSSARRSRTRTAARCTSSPRRSCTSRPRATSRSRSRTSCRRATTSSSRTRACRSACRSQSSMSEPAAGPCRRNTAIQADGCMYRDHVDSCGDVYISHSRLVPEDYRPWLSLPALATKVARPRTSRA